mmetsp:Transcript_16054/g.24203  ORF Transcript_16054/g.24203 Transcript_16054/m.24203 type:complete len:406 (+) Transcript_16054:65-1282(+)
MRLLLLLALQSVCVTCELALSFSSSGVVTPTQDFLINIPDDYRFPSEEAAYFKIINRDSVILEYPLADIEEGVEVDIDGEHLNSGDNDLDIILYSDSGDVIQRSTITVFVPGDSKLDTPSISPSPLADPSPLQSTASFALYVRFHQGAKRLSNVISNLIHPHILAATGMAAGAGAVSLSYSLGSRIVRTQSIERRMPSQLERIPENIPSSLLPADSDNRKITSITSGENSVSLTYPSHANSKPQPINREQAKISGPKPFSPLMRPQPHQFNVLSSVDLESIRLRTLRTLFTTRSQLQRAQSKLQSAVNDRLDSLSPDTRQATLLAIQSSAIVVAMQAAKSFATYAVRSLRKKRPEKAPTIVQQRSFKAELNLKEEIMQECDRLKLKLIEKVRGLREVVKKSLFDK